jgi:hypothetical protein
MNPVSVAVRRICRDFAFEAQSHRSPINQEVHQKTLMEEQADFVATPLFREIRLARGHLRECDPDAQSREVLEFAFQLMHPRQPTPWAKRRTSSTDMGGNVSLDHQTDEVLPWDRNISKVCGMKAGNVQCVS